MNEQQTTPKIVIGPGREQITDLTGLILGYEKFSHPTKHYRLIWLRRREKVGKGQHPFEAWLCEEDRTHYRTAWGGSTSSPGAVEAGQKLAVELGVTFSEVTR